MDTIIRNVLNSKNMLDFISAQPKKLSCRNCQAWKRGKEKYKDKGDKKTRREAYFWYLKENCVYIS